MDWKEINSKYDIDVLLTTFGGFHDGVLREMHFWNDYYVDEDLQMISKGGMFNAKVLFQRQGKDTSTIEMLFLGIDRINIVSTPPYHWYMISDATLIYKDGLYYWAEVGNWQIGDNSVTWISSKDIKWRIVDNGLGSKLRYGCNDEIGRSF